ncbi:hypothetical protein BHYA_0023g00650 [Botrytis hyacinthi]|uniref:Uncharacterized protein n=1 Tax=Botrytis hyacinthi TaxID=278943 RepID=A0A4Z1GXT3_9HELO|nr:hypothetical protein BHYA_0023g00650 [Botrytis hyacinthi]
MTTPRSRQDKRDVRFKEEQAKLDSKIYGGGNQRSSYTSSGQSNSGSGYRREGIPDHVRKEALRHIAEKLKDEIANSVDLCDKIAKDQGKKHRSGGTKDHTDLSKSKIKK